MRLGIWEVEDAKIKTRKRKNKTKRRKKMKGGKKTKSKRKKTKAKTRRKRGGRDCKKILKEEKVCDKKSWMKASENFIQIKEEMVIDLEI